MCSTGRHHREDTDSRGAGELPAMSEAIDELGRRVRAAVDALRNAGWGEIADRIVERAALIDATRNAPGEDTLAGTREALLTIADNTQAIAELLGQTYPDPLHLQGERP